MNWKHSRYSPFSKNHLKKPLKIRTYDRSVDVASNNNELLPLFETYTDELKYAGRLSDETRRGYRNVFNLFVKVMPEISGVRLLTREMLIEFFKRIETRQRIVGKDTPKTGVKNSTIRTQYYKLTGFFDWLNRRGYLEVNPLASISPPKVNYDDHRSLEDHEIHKIYSAIARKSGSSLIQARDTLMVSLLLFLGLRKGEFISLQVRDVNLGRGEITIRAETSKSKRQRVLPIHPTLLLRMKDYFQERNKLKYKTEHLIVSSRADSGLTREGLKHWVNALKNKSGVKFHLHRLRHSFAGKLAQSNVGTFNIQKLLGHSSVSMTEMYVRSLRTEDMWADVAKISID